MTQTTALIGCCTYTSYSCRWTLVTVAGGHLWNLRWINLEAVSQGVFLAGLILDDFFFLSHIFVVCVKWLHSCGININIGFQYFINTVLVYFADQRSLWSLKVCQLGAKFLLFVAFCKSLAKGISAWSVLLVVVFSFCAHRHSVLGQLHSKFMAQNAEWFIRLYWEIMVRSKSSSWAERQQLCITCSSHSHLCCETNWVQCNGFGSYLWLWVSAVTVCQSGYPRKDV